ncbi:glutathione S-transferase T3-like protein [Tanacetum coccineum]
MGGSLSQRRTDPPVSPIHEFPIEDMYTSEFLDSFQLNTGSFQETVREDSPVEVATSPPKTKKPTRGRQKRTIQSDDAPRQVAWTNEEEIALCKGWVYVSENSSVGNTRKDVGFWCEVLQYMESKTNQYGRRTYDMVNGKWKTVRPAVVRFCGVYGNVLRRLQESGASDEDYYAMALVDYEAETGTTFKLRHCWEILKGSPKWMQSEVPKFAAKSGEGSKRYKTSGSSSFNIESGEASINLNANVGDDEEDEVQEIRRPIGRDKAKDVAKKKGSRASGSSSMNDEALARLMEYRQRQEDIRFYLQPYDHLVGDAQAAMESLRAEINAKYNLPY